MLLKSLKSISFATSYFPWSINAFRLTASSLVQNWKNHHRPAYIPFLLSTVVIRWSRERHAALYATIFSFSLIFFWKPFTYIFCFSFRSFRFLRILLFSSTAFSLSLEKDITSLLDFICKAEYTCLFHGHDPLLSSNGYFSSRNLPVAENLESSLFRTAYATYSVLPSVESSFLSVFFVNSIIILPSS